MCLVMKFRNTLKYKHKAHRVKIRSLFTVLIVNLLKNEVIVFVDKLCIYKDLEVDAQILLYSHLLYKQRRANL